MTARRLDQLMAQTEAHIECWKQFNRFISVARSKKFGPPEEAQFLELKSIIAQELEMIFDSIETRSPTKDEIISLIERAPSLRCLSGLGEGELRSVENSWHKIYIAWHSVLGQLKIRQSGGEMPPCSKAA